MNKKLVAAAVASALVAPMAAQAESTVYAHVQFEIANIDKDGSDSKTNVTDRERGRLGIKGSHDLGGGLSSWAIAEFDFEGGNRDAEFGGTQLVTNEWYGIDTMGAITTTVSNKVVGTAVGYTQRNAFRVREIAAGLKGSFGSIGLGTVKSAYKYMGGVKYDPFVTTTLEARGNDGMSGGAGGHHAFLSNALVYTGKFGMVNLHATYSPDTTDRDGDGQDDDGELSAGIKFGGKSWEAGLATYDEGVSEGAGASGTNQSSTKAFGSMSFGNNTIRLQYEDVDSGAAVNGSTEFIWAGYELKLGKGLLNVQYAMVDPDGDNNDHDMLTVGYIHKFNKQTRIFAGWHSVDDDRPNRDEDTLAVGIRVNI